MEDLPNVDSWKSEAQKMVPIILGISTGIVAIGAGGLLAKAIIISNLELAEVVQLLTLPVLAATVIVAVWAHKRNAEFDKSREYLDHAVEVIDRARKVLTNPDGTLNNGRIRWVTAARLITRAEHVINLISIDVHRKILEAEHDFQRHQFIDQIEATAGERDLPASFFLGAEYKGLSIGQAAYHPSQSEHADKWIPEKMIATVYRFFQYPEDYEDPLHSSTRFGSSERLRLWFLGHRGACDFVTFKENFSRVNTKVFRTNSGSQESTYVRDVDIDRQMDLLSGT